MHENTVNVVDLYIINESFTGGKHQFVQEARTIPVLRSEHAPFSYCRINFVHMNQEIVFCIHTEWLQYAVEAFRSLTQLTHNQPVYVSNCIC